LNQGLSKHVACDSHFVLSRDAHEILNRGDAEIKAFALTIASRGAQCSREILRRVNWAGRG
jgi:hypothetical protein